MFNFQLGEKVENVVWLKDNKPMEDKLADRVFKKELDQATHSLEIKHCRDTDSGLYTAMVTTGGETSTCTAQLVVEKCEYLFQSYNCPILWALI